MRLAASALVTVVFAALVVLAVANRAPVVLILDPISGADGPTLTLPLYGIVFAALAAGVILGGSAVSLSRRQPRRTAPGEIRPRRGRWRGRERRAPRAGATALPPTAVRPRGRGDR